MADYQRLIDNEVSRLKARDNVRAVAVVGSYARDPDDDHTDIDIYVIVDGNWRRRETERIDGIVVERFYNSVEWSERYLDGEQWYTNYRWYCNADVRYDPDGLFDRLEAYAMEKKDEHLDLDEDDRQAIRYFIWDMQQDIEQANGAQQLFLMHTLFEYLLEKQYLLQDEVPVKENYRITKLADFDQEMHDMATEFLEADADEKRNILDDIVDHVTADLGNPDPEWKTARETL